MTLRAVVGNFLTETYISLRRLENEVLAEYYNSKTNENQIRIKEQLIKVNINQFYGIEINDFGCKVAETALWIAESQMLDETNEILGTTLLEFPLNNNNNIHCGNSLRVEWNNIVRSKELNYIISNPPFTGKKDRTLEQKEDLIFVFGKTTKLDYVCAWYKKAFDYIKDTLIRVAFVSTNSITQGEQPYVLWNDILGKKIKIDFAYTSFKWESIVKEKASVCCVIIGFSNIETENCIYTIDGRKVEYINAYLHNSSDFLLKNRNKTICNISQLSYGSSPIDNGHLILNEIERKQILNENAENIKYIREFIGGDEIINGKKRYCIWLKDINPLEVNNSRFIMNRIKLTKEFREKSNRKETAKKANIPYLFGEIRQPNVTNEMIVIPKVSSKNRDYIPIAFVKPNIIINENALIMENSSLYNFGILNSKIHMFWIETVAGRFKEDYTYSVGIVYNNFPWCSPTDKQKEKIEKTAKAILDARTLYPNNTLADLYNKYTMPIELRKAHNENDKVVMEAYGFDKNLTKDEIVDKLMEMYKKIVNEE